MHNFATVKSDLVSLNLGVLIKNVYLQVEICVHYMSKTASTTSRELGWMKMTMVNYGLNRFNIAIKLSYKFQTLLQ